MRGSADNQGKMGGPALRRVLGQLQHHRAAAAMAGIAILVVLAANLTVPLLVRMAIDEGVMKHDQDALGLAVGCLVGIALLRGLFGFLQVYLAERVSHGVAYRLRDELFVKIQRLGFAYYDRTEAGQLLTRLTNDVDQVRTFIGTGLAQIVQSAVMLVASIAAIFWLEWRLAIVALISVLPIGIVMGRFTRLIGPLLGKLQHQMGALNTILREALLGVRTVRAFGRQAHEAERYGSVNQALLGHAVTATRLAANTFPVVMFSANLSTLLIIGFGGYLVMQGSLTIGTLLAFTSYMGFLIQPLMTLGFAVMITARAGVSAGRIAEVFDAPTDVPERADARALPTIEGHIVFDNVSFRYPGAESDVLSGVSFDVAPGETVAIVGMTGSGKSSLAHLLPRFYDVTAGKVTVDGHDVRDVTLPSLRGQLGVVLQEPLLFGGTLAANIAYGKPDAGPDAIAVAARAAMADGFINDLPDGYETVIGERGVGLSGGQRQRIAIARALLVAPRVIILDDSTSAVDARTEATIQAALDELMRTSGRTCLVIAHRASTVRAADRILVLDKGRLVAQGTHEELLRTSPIYQDILGSQLAGATR